MENFYTENKNRTHIWTSNLCLTDKYLSLNALQAPELIRISLITETSPSLPNSLLLVSVIVNGTIYLIAQIPSWYLLWAPSLYLSSTPNLSIANNSCLMNISHHFSSRHQPSNWLLPFLSFPLKSILHTATRMLFPYFE